MANFNAIFAQTPGWLWVVFACAFGALLGSFVNAAIYRLPQGISMVTKTRSFCPECKAQIGWYDNVPILSYLILAGKCRACKKPIPSRYLWVEVLVTALFAFASFQFFVLNSPIGPPGGTMPWALYAVQLFLILDLVCLSVVDLEMWLIPIQTTIIWIPVGLILGGLCPELHLDPTPWTSKAWLNGLIDSFNGVVVGGGILWGVGFLCIWWFKKEGMGAGDAHLLAMVGAMLGWKAAIMTFMLGIFIGLTTGIAGILWSKYQRRKLGKDYKPRKPRYELPDAEEDQGPPPATPLLVYGLIVVPVEVALYVTYFQNALSPGYEATLISASVCLIIGMGLLVAYPIQKNLIATKRWPMGQVQEREDGKKEEVLEGNYIPFGPSLAVAGLTVAFYYPALASLVNYNFLQKWLPLPFHMLGVN